jgi:hypothetical protein
MEKLLGSASTNAGVAEANIWVNRNTLQKRIHFVFPSLAMVAKSHFSRANSSTPISE